jgi:outer membrane receptor protein involved in Fe transport
MKMKTRFVAILLLGFASCLTAQTNGELRGTVSDPQRKPQEGVRVIARFEATGAVRNATTDAQGEFVFPASPIGSYTVQVGAEGYKDYAQHVDVTLGHVIEIAIVLEVGESTQVLDSEEAEVEVASTQLGAIMNTRTVVGLPLNARNTYQLLQLQPGVESLAGYDLFIGSENPGVVSVNGGRARANNYNVNGGNANDLFAGLPAIQPSPDTIAEFRVLTNTFNAEFGRNSGSVVNVVTVGGSNEFHGSALEFFRNTTLDARGFFDTQTPKFNQNQFGGTFGGRVIKDRSFVFLSAEDRLIRQGISSDVVVVPTSAERSGDFSAGSPFAGILNGSALAKVLNQRPGCASAVGGGGGAPIAANTPWAAIFPNNKVPAQCFDPTAADLLHQFVPLPNSGTNLFEAAPVESSTSFQQTARFDEVLNANHQASFYYFLEDDASMQPFSTLQAAGANLPGFGSDYGTRNQQFNLSETWSINAATVNEWRITYLREGELSYNHPQRTGLVSDSCTVVPAGSCFADPADPRLGITPGLGAGREGVPYIQLGGAFSIGNNAQGELPQVGNSFQWADNLSKVMGSHSAKFGVDVRRHRFDQTLYYNVNGSFNFYGGGANDIGADSQFPNFLLGLPTSYAQGSAQTENIRDTSVSLYAQDSWSITKRLTLNYGLRWELNTPMRDTGNRIQTFRPGQATSQFPCQLAPGNPLIATFGTSSCGPGTAGESVFPLGLVVPGDTGVPSGLTATDYTAFAPRIGLAWHPASASGWRRKVFGGEGKTSFRSGWGLFYNPMEQLVMEQFSAEPPFGGSTALANTMFNTPFLGQDGTVNANPFNGILSPKAGSAVDWSVFRPILMFGDFQPRLRTQSAVQYNFTIQREFHRDLLLQTGYVGTQGHHLLATHDLNYGLAQPCLDLNQLSILTGNASLSCGPFSADRTFTVPADAIPPGFTLHLPYGPVQSVTGPNATPIRLVGLRRYSSPLCNPLTGTGCAPDGVPVFSSIFSEDSIANSNFNSLQVLLEKRAVAGLQFQAAYTFGKSIDNASSFENLLNPLNYSLSRSLSLFDARQRLALSYDWMLPRVQWAGPVKKAVNGWSFSGILTLQSGFPVPMASSDDLELMNSLDFTTAGLPNLVKPFQALNPRNGYNLAFDPTSFAQPTQLGLIGDSPRAVCCGPGIANLDVALQKTTAITERASLQFRAEFFNMPNHAQFSKVDGNISDGQVQDGGTFGKVLSARDPRLIQFALKVLF